jgi:hypothetical protein
MSASFLSILFIATMIGTEKKKTLLFQYNIHEEELKINQESYNLYPCILNLYNCDILIFNFYLYYVLHYTFYRLYKHHIHFASDMCV